MHPLIDRLTADLGWPLLEDMEGVRAFLDAPGVHCLFVPGDPARNLESADVAVIVPELRQCFQNAFDCAVVADAVSGPVRDMAESHKTPNLVFARDGRVLGSIPKVRDWDDYMGRIRHLLALRPEVA